MHRGKGPHRSRGRVFAVKTSDVDAASVEFSRKAAAQAYGLSRAHATGILARAERLDIPRRNGSRIIPSGVALHNVRRDLACQLAFVVLWLEALRT